MKYLKMTIYDNDFTRYYEEIGTLISSLIMHDAPPTEESLDKLKPYIARLWWAAFNIHDVLREIKTPMIKSKETDYEYFENNLELSIVEESDIPEWDNAEDIYIPLDNRQIRLV